MVRVVLDTSVLISATLVELGFSAQLLNMARAGKIKLIVSDALLAEYAVVVQRPHITRKYTGVAERFEDIRRFLLAEADLVVGMLEGVVVADPKDDVIVGCALEGGADYIVSGDPHLLNLKEYQGIKIVSPRQMVEATLGADRSKEETSL